MLIASATLPVGAPPLFGAIQVPEPRVVPVAAAVVSDGGPNVLGNAVNPAAEIVDALRLQIWMLVQRRVQIGDVRLVVLSVMDLHRLRIDVRFERSEVVRKFGEFVRHEFSSKGGEYSSGHSGPL